MRFKGMFFEYMRFYSESANDSFRPMISYTGHMDQDVFGDTKEVSTFLGIVMNCLQNQSDAANSNKIDPDGK